MEGGSAKWYRMKSLFEPRVREANADHLGEVEQESFAYTEAIVSWEPQGSKEWRGHRPPAHEHKPLKEGLQVKAVQDKCDYRSGANY
jgi:hypothetical protein